ncbi:MAG TPA: heme peroxidase family protein [Conexibacter sp.]|nr:heme peroxidase family protein [Conexibacter sp.]
MNKHGSESYFVVGEGLLSESVGGRDETQAVAAAARAAGPTAQAARAAPPFRFSRMGPNGRGRQLGEANRAKLGVAMTAGRGAASQVPAGFTYLGQFVDHDLTFDKTSVMLGVGVSPAQLLQARSPSLDLDSLYGAGPQDPESAKFYAADGVHLKMGSTVAAGPDRAMAGFDLPRGAGRSVAARRKAVIPDPRNDENLAVAQTHLAFIRFHNRVVDTLPRSVPQAQRFATAREIVTKHYQWMLRTDLLPRICARAVVDDVFANGRKAFEVGVDPTEVPTMPIEFSIAAYRLGHSMIRAAYNWNRRFDNGAGTLGFLFLFSATSGDLGGSPRLPSNWIADFRRLYDFGDAGRRDLVVPARRFNRAMRIDTLLVNPLRNLPTGSFGGPSVPLNDPRANLAFRNLTRARMVNLTTGQQLARFLRRRGVRVRALTGVQVRDGRGGASLARLTQAQRAALVRDTPLWFYVLREAELNGGRLAGVGARVVAETFHRAIEGSTASIVRDPRWRPTLGPNRDTFRMVDLLLFAFEGRRALLAPLG